MGAAILALEDSLLKAARAAPDVVIFDGACNFCRWQMRLLRRVDREGLLHFLSAQDPATHERYPDLGQERLMREMYVVTAAGERLPGVEAIRYLSRRLRLLWPFALILHAPGTAGLWRWLYAKVAGNRYLFGRTGESCEIPNSRRNTS